ERPAVLKIRTNHFANRCYLVSHRQRGAIAFGEPQVSIGMYSAAEIEIRSGKKAQVCVGENSELKHGDRDGLDRSLKPHFRTECTARRYLQSVWGQETDQTGISA